jgi:sulfur dioxygenase
METLYFHASRGCLSYITYDPVSLEGVLVDPSEEIACEVYTDALASHSIKLRYILETHTHADHISSAKAIKEITKAIIVRSIHAPSKTADRYVDDNDVLVCGEKTLRIIYTPGHTNESISLYNGKEVFTGDTLLLGGTGRTDFQVGDSEQLYDSIHEKLELLPHDTLIRPGHNYKGKQSGVLGEELHTSERLLLCKEGFTAYMNEYHPPKPELFEIALEKNSQ